MGAKHQKLLLGNNAPGKCFPSQMQHFFSPSPAQEEKFAESAFIHTKIKPLSLNRWIYEPIDAKHQKLLLDNNAPGKCLQAHMQHFFSASPAIEKKFAVSAFYAYKNQKLVMKPLGAKHQKLLLCPWQVLSLPKPMKNSLSQGPKTKNYTKFLQLLLGWVANNAYPGKCIFFIQKSKTCHETVEFMSQWGQNTKNYSWVTMSQASAFKPTCNISSALAPLSRKISLRQHFFHPKIKSLSLNRWIYEPMGAKHQKTTPWQQCPWQVLSLPNATFLQP